MEGNRILGSWRSWRFGIFGQNGKEKIFPTVSFIGKSPGRNSLEIAHSLKIITNYNSYLLCCLLDLGRHQDGQKAEGRIWCVFKQQAAMTGKVSAVPPTLFLKSHACDRERSRISSILDCQYLIVSHKQA